MQDHHCGGADHFSRRGILKAAGIGAASGLSWLTPLSRQIARADESNSDPRRAAATAKSLIVLWMEGAPSQLETFDPHPDTDIAAGSKARKTNVPDILLGEGLEQVAEEMDSISIVRALTSQEGDHERAIYNVKTGYRMDPTLVHPSIGSIICHQIGEPQDSGSELPRHVSMIPQSQPGRGGYLGDQFDAFKVPDPIRPVPDVVPRVEGERMSRRIEQLSFLDQQFLSGRLGQRQDAAMRSMRQSNVDAALKMMSSEQLSAFDVSRIPVSQREPFGDSAFGRSCLAAIGLIQAGVRCVEITLSGWDSHINNHEIQAERIGVLDPAYASLIRELKKRDLLDSTLVVCGGEFGRTPRVNKLGGRDHWPHGFSMALAGGGVQGGRVLGETSPTPKTGKAERTSNLADPRPVEDIHATILYALGIDGSQELQTPIGRPIKICEGTPIKELFS